MWRVTGVFYGQLPLSGYSRSWGKRMEKQGKLEGSNASLMYHPGVSPEWPLAGISHLASCPRQAHPYFVIFVLLHSFASSFSSCAMVPYLISDALPKSPSRSAC